jgi:hypothetical protein
MIFGQEKSFDGWTHLELGAGNYGQDGHTKASQARTVLMKFTYVSQARNFIDDLDETGRLDYKPEDQYAVLFWTLDQLVHRFGEKGVFHVNDLYEEYALYAAEKLREYAAAKGYSSVVINAVSGDYQGIDPEKTLAIYGRKKYDSVHLKNPESSLFHYGMDGERFLSSEQTRLETRKLLQQLANLSKEGFFLFVLYHDDFLPAEERMEFFEKGIFYLPTEQWEPVHYVYPEGKIDPDYSGKVFFIKNISGA